MSPSEAEEIRKAFDCYYQIRTSWHYTSFSDCAELKSAASLKCFWKHCFMKEAGHKRPHIICFHLYEMSRKVKPLETESRLVVSRGWSKERGRSDPLMETRFSLGVMKLFWN